MKNQQVDALNDGKEKSSFIRTLKKRAADDFTRVSVRRVLMALLFAGVIIGAFFTGVYLTASDTSAFLYENINAAIYDPDFMNAGRKDLMKEPFGTVCSKDKDLALYYLVKKSKIRATGFRVHKIKFHENFWSIAKNYKVDVDSIVGCNPELKDMFARKDQDILVPVRPGVLYQVKTGENVKKIADKFGVGEDLIKTSNKTGFFLSDGDMIFIPDAKPVELSGSLAKIYEKRNIFRSPLAGRYTSLKGLRKDPILQGVTKFHNGVDIKAPVGTWVGAAAAGRILEAGWNNGYGNYIKIDHHNGYTTLYGHLSKIYVHSGQTVKAGSLIAKSGNTGRSTGPHLHFSIFKGDKVMNPLDYLW